MTKALVSTTTSPLHRISCVHTLYGDPDHYAYKFGNETRSNRSLSMSEDWLRFHGVDFLHCMSIDYNTQQIYFGNNLDERLEFGPFVYFNSTSTRYFDFVPETDQVSLL